MLTLILWIFVQKDVDKACKCNKKYLFFSRAVVQSMTCGFVCLTENCFSSCFIMAQGEKQKTENIFRTLKTADCYSGGQPFNPTYVTCALQIFRVWETRKWCWVEFLFILLLFFPNLILFLGILSKSEQEDVMITHWLWSFTTVHTCIRTTSFETLPGFVYLLFHNTFHVSPSFVCFFGF